MWPLQSVATLTPVQGRALMTEYTRENKMYSYGHKNLSKVDNKGISCSAVAVQVVLWPTWNALHTHTHTHILPLQTEKGWKCWHCVKGQRYLIEKKLQHSTRDEKTASWWATLGSPHNNTWKNDMNQTIQT